LLFKIFHAKLEALNSAQTAATTLFALKSYLEESHFVRLTQHFNCSWAADSFDSVATSFGDHLKAIGSATGQGQLLKSFIELHIKVELQRSQNLLRMLSTESRFTDYWQTHRIQAILIMGEYLVSFINSGKKNTISDVVESADILFEVYLSTWVCLTSQEKNKGNHVYMRTARQVLEAAYLLLDALNSANFDTLLRLNKCQTLDRVLQ